ncbi:hypothetical protein [Ornithinimicrobium murale]|uniref:hypothetical protein n=1 Tax=Ornithinimicrobium murale TaxID=1050153 RepID=UPI000E0D1DDD|nr:hypothetical protein [Ornithinimicrobium murale]
MNGALRVVLWAALAVGLVLAVVIAVGLFRLSQTFPDADQGRALGEQLESELGTDHPQFVTETAADPSFAEVRVDIHQRGGELTEPEVSELLETLREVTVEHADSRWSLEISVEGRWGTSPVTITGSAADQWPELSQALELADSNRTALSFSLDTGRVALTRDVDTERLCGPGTEPLGFFTDTVGEAGAVLTELGWANAEAPVLVYLASGCDGPLRTSLELSGSNRLEKLQDLEALVASLPAEHSFVGITVQDAGHLEVGLDREPTGPAATALAAHWPHGEVWINGTAVTSP